MKQKSLAARRQSTIKKSKNVSISKGKGGKGINKTLLDVDE